MVTSRPVTMVTSRPVTMVTSRPVGGTTRQSGPPLIWALCPYGEVRQVPLERHALARCAQLLLSCNATRQLSIVLRVHDRSAQGQPLPTWVGYLLSKFCWDTACNLPLVVQLLWLDDAFGSDPFDVPAIWESRPVSCTTATGAFLGRISASVFALAVEGPDGQEVEVNLGSLMASVGLLPWCEIAPMSIQVLVGVPLAHLLHFRYWGPERAISLWLESNGEWFNSVLPSPHLNLLLHPISSGTPPLERKSSGNPSSQPSNTWKVSILNSPSRELVTADPSDPPPCVSISVRVSTCWFHLRVLIAFPNSNSILPQVGCGSKPPPFPLLIASRHC